MPKTYYKVCATYEEYPNTYFSFNCGPMHRNLCLVYKPDIWTFPIIKNSHLYCFDSIGEARDFIRYNLGNAHIFSCYVKNPRYTKWIGNPCNTSQIHAFWETKSKHLNKHLRYDAPRGTISVSAIKILEKIVDNKQIGWQEYYGV